MPALHVNMTAQHTTDCTEVRFKIEPELRRDDDHFASELMTAYGICDFEAPLAMTVRIGIDHPHRFTAARRYARCG